MKKIVYLLLFIFFANIVNAQNLDYKLSRVFSTKGLEKAHSIDMDVYYPDTWKAENIDLPNVVQRFSNKEGNVVNMLVITDMLGAKLGGNEANNRLFSKNTTIYDVINDENIKDLLGGGNFTSFQSERASLDGIPTIKVIAKMDFIFEGVNIHMMAQAYFFIFDAKLINISYNVYDYDNDSNLENTFNDNQKLFALMLEKLVFKNNSKKDILNNVKQYLKEEKKSFSTKHHPKAKGIDLLVEYPSSWIVSEAKRPNLVQLFKEDSSDEMNSSSCVINIRDLSQMGISEEDMMMSAQEKEREMSLLIKDKDFINSLFAPQTPSNVKIIQNKVDGEPAIQVSGSVVQSIMGATFQQDSISNMFFYKNKMILLQCINTGVVQNEQDKLLLKEKFDRYQPVFLSFIHSAVLNNKWNDWSEGTNFSSENKVNNNVLGNNYLWLSLLIGFIIIWGIGLFPPLITRYKILKKPMRKNSAIAFAGIFWIINLITFISLGSESKTHGAVVLIAFASYYILRAGAEDKEKKKMTKK